MNIKESISLEKDSINQKTNITQQRRIYATGKRKTAVAKVWISFVDACPGTITINGLDVLSYFKRPVDRMIINQPLGLLKINNSYNINCQVSGSGLSGQAGAIRHGLSKALKEVDSQFHKTLRNIGFLTRDSRKVERKKYGQPKARKKFQFSKR